MNTNPRELVGRLKFAKRMSAPKKIEEFFYTCDTPKLIYSSQLLMNSIDRLRTDSKDVLDFKLYYSVKANINDDVMKFIGNRVDGMDVSSEYEYKLARAAGIQHIISTAPVPAESFIMQLYENGYIFDFDSINSIERCKRFLVLGKKNKIGLRLRISNQEIGNDVQAKESRFGISLTEQNEVNRLNRVLKESSLTICQLHYHGRMGGVEHLKKICDYICHLLQNCVLLKDVSSISLGGGIDLFYMLGNSHVEGFWNVLSLFSRETKKKNISILLEPGEQIVSTCGFLIVQVTDSVFRDGRQHLTVDSSAFNLLSWQELYPHCINVLNHCFYGNSNMHNTTIWGQTCYEEDIFIRNMYLPKMRLGDRIVFYPMGAYAATTARHLHQIPTPVEILI